MEVGGQNKSLSLPVEMNARYFDGCERRRRLFAGLPRSASFFSAMGNKYYQPGAERAERVGDLFATIANRYDLINDLQSFGLHRAWKRRLVRLAAPQPGERALDICCGTGDITLALAHRGAEVVGLDFSEPMLAVAKSKVNSEFRVSSS